MENQNLKNQVSEKPKKSFGKFITIFLIIIVIAAVGFFIWNKYFSPEAQYEKRIQEIKNMPKNYE